MQEHNRAGRAELRRCQSATEVAFVPSYHALLQRLGSRLNEVDARRVALVAAVLSHVEREPHGAPSLGRQMGQSDGGPARISDSRFRHLLTGADDETTLRELVRVVRQLKREASVERLAQDLMHWDDAVRLRWARDYYETTAAPKATEARE
jgi:CRISPR type I-E-associated protein CasB/Cse2